MINNYYYGKTNLIFFIGFFGIAIIVLFSLCTSKLPTFFDCIIFFFKPTASGLSLLSGNKRNCDDSIN